MAISFNRPQNDVNISQTSSSGTDFSRPASYQGLDSSGNNDKDLTRNPLVVAGVVAGAGALAGGIINAISQNHANHTNLQLNRDNNALNKELAFMQNEWNEKMWNKQNDYNKPSEQIKRLKEAGVNPTLAMSQLSPGTADQLQSAELANQQAGHVNPITGVGDGLSQASQSVSNIMVQKEQLRIADKEATTHRMDVESQMGKRTAEILKLKEDTKNAQKEFERIEAEIDRIKADKDLKVSQKDLNDYERELKIRFGEKEIIARCEQMESSKELNMVMKEFVKSNEYKNYMDAWSNRISALAQQKTSNASSNLMSAQESYTNKMIGSYDLMVDNMLKQGKLTDAQAEYIKKQGQVLFYQTGIDALKVIGSFAALGVLL